jgi:hypothetical protein
VKGTINAIFHWEGATNGFPPTAACQFPRSIDNHLVSMGIKRCTGWNWSLRSEARKYQYLLALSLAAFFSARRNTSSMSPL